MRRFDRREFGFEEVLPKSILWTDRGWDAVKRLDRPIDGKDGIVPEDGAFSGPVVEVRGLVEDLCGVREDNKAVGKAFGNPEELQLVSGGLGFQMESGPSAEVGGFAPKIDRHVPNMAGENSDELGLRPAELIVKAAKYSFDREGLIVLHKIRR